MVIPTGLRWLTLRIRPDKSACGKVFPRHRLLFRVDDGLTGSNLSWNEKWFYLRIAVIECEATPRMHAEVSPVLVR